MSIEEILRIYSNTTDSLNNQSSLITGDINSGVIILEKTTDIFSSKSRNISLPETEVTALFKRYTMLYLPCDKRQSLHIKTFRRDELALYLICLNYMYRQGRYFLLFRPYFHHLLCTNIY